MRDHNYHSRMKNCQVRFVLTVDNEKSLCEKKKSPFEIIDWFFSEPVRPVSGVFWRDFLSSWMVEQMSAEDFRVYWLLKEPLHFILYIWSCRIRNLCNETWGTHKNAYRWSLTQGWTKCPAVRKSLQNFHWKVLSNFLIVFDVSSEL